MKSTCPRFTLSTPSENRMKQFMAQGQQQNYQSRDNRSESSRELGENPATECLRFGSVCWRSSGEECLGPLIPLVTKRTQEPDEPSSNPHSSPWSLDKRLHSIGRYENTPAFRLNFLHYLMSRNDASDTLRALAQRRYAIALPTNQPRSRDIKITTLPRASCNNMHIATRRDIRGNCLVCIETLLDERRLVWCRDSCGQSVHADCLSQWIDQREQSDLEPPSCVHCRQPWGNPCDCFI